MKSIYLWLYFVAALMTSCKANAEYVDNLPPIPYQAYALIKGATINLSKTQFGEAIKIKGGDPRRVIAILLKQRGGKEGQELFDAATKCDDETIPHTDNDKVRCIDAAMDAAQGSLMIFTRDYGRAVFKLAGYSFDKSIVAYANDCNTFGSCTIVIDNVLKLTNNMESVIPIGLFSEFCSSSTPSVRKRFLALNVAAACTKIMSFAPLKEKLVCADKYKVRDRSGCDDKVKSKTKYCTETGDLSYPEIDCN